VSSPSDERPTQRQISDLSLDQLIMLQEADSVPTTPRPRQSDSGGNDGTADRDLVLPWWMRPINVVALIVTTALIAGMVGFMVGDAAAEPDPNEVDIGFLQDMRGHHEQAVQMGFIYLTIDDTDPGLRTIARSIIFGQGIEIGRMIQMLRDVGATEANETGVAMTWMGMSADVDDMPGMATNDELLVLGNAAGAEADQIFVDLMTEHHLGGIEMATFAAERAALPEVRRMAAAMAGAQSDEIAEMRGQLD